MTSGLDYLVADLETMINAHECARQAMQVPVQAADSRAAFTVDVRASGQLTRVQPATAWRERVQPDEVGAAVLEAVRNAEAQQWEFWWAAIKSDDVAASPPTQHKSRLGGPAESEPAIERGSPWEPAFATEGAWGDGSLPLADLGEASDSPESWTSGFADALFQGESPPLLADLDDPVVAEPPAAPAHESVSFREEVVRVELTRSGEVESVYVSPRWAASVDRTTLAERLTRAFQTAYANHDQMTQ
ncbi:hypothetical protein ABN028_10870 [Actinopolymorpha sp. B17G11]|uniref:hypothetical protein n=1 Tax=Actinopolymorpha sp. B17G11 TaxID=3160861 RepID=UPI0032E4E1DE